MNIKKLRNIVDNATKKMEEEFKDEIKCKKGCSDCCSALFDLTLIEALYINKKFNETFEGNKKIVLLEKANKVNRQIYKIKRNAFKEFQNGKSELEIIGQMSVEKVPCPLLNKKQECDLYEYRPLNCMVYGFPVESSGKGHICGLSKFKEGNNYTTINIDKIYLALHEISKAFVKSIKTKYIKMAAVLIPLSMSLLTSYDDEYLGIIKEKNESNVQYLFFKKIKILIELKV